ncbi:YjjG family noncanonical pyrimidine nucleotidase [Flavobacterium psychrophilum]|uniref:Noncanonical pyrimidine nucleotidase, YjjG family n=2 Tax=Flavobacterium psychrophilum TaxID=96345 RepID=A0A076NW38_FLAPS|nr:YjjG family noncanonical pyrimidine nucleotidase [Flavobacterium psychrophilum]AIJ38759.1 Hydrolase (HAD superfamily) [Flavobacterium psychrophilum]AIN72397.1 haloacid dehalogenase [Flavobacterium psychrophilum FPG101]AKC19445.1 haloacid dehalogenase [Flavobacterium psychrophilum]AKC24185.1 haloacid dehalogenase [Flavobacterium psychrophilum]AKC28813.1 haloacid dehalogenase [Flavobacterium psychrophilum]
MKHSIKHIFFDLDHTLWDFDKNSELAFGLILSNYFPDIKIEDFVAIYAPINQACWKLYQKDKITHQELRYKRLKDTFDILNQKISDKQIDLISDEYIEFLPDFNHLFDNAIEVLNFLSENYQLHIITNGFAQVQDKKLNNSNISHYFQTITNSELAGAKKPNPIIFEHALKVANAQKHESIMIGDCLDADVKGALDFGIEAIFFNPNKIQVPQSINQIANLAELIKLF